jgi:dihydroorotate dehydrogenase electron transfer subunit
MIFQLRTEVLFNYQVGPLYYKIGLNAAKIVNCASPGQFVMVRVSDHLDPLLRRPFSIHRVSEKTASLEILFKVVGRGTKTMSDFGQEDYMDVMGPMGNNFRILPQSQKIHLVAGGIGVAPLYWLAESAVTAGKEVVIFLGGKTQNDILCLDEFQGLGVQTCIATEDGSLGERGLVSELFEKRLKAPYPQAIYACGPRPMLIRIGWISQVRHIPCQVSLESSMACGVGACLGCVVKKRVNDQKTTYVNVCSDGPIFDAHLLIYDD